MRIFMVVATLVMVAGGGARADAPPAAATVAVSAARPDPVPDGGIYLGWGGGLAPSSGASAMASSSLVIDRQLFWRIGLWVSGEAFYVVHPGEDDLAMRLCIGARVDLFRSENRKLRVISNLAFTHQHEAVTSLWAQHPVENLLGESKFGLGHRSGIEAGAGLLITPWIDSKVRAARRLRVLVRASAAWLPDGNGPALYLALLTSVGVAL